MMVATGCVAAITVGYFSFIALKPAAFYYSSNPIVESLEKMGNIVGLRVQIGDVLEVQSEGGAGTFTGVKGVWIIKGDALLSTDLRDAKIALDDQDKVIKINLPEPQILSPRVDHEKTKQYDFRSGWITAITGREQQAQLHQDAMKNAQRAVENAAGLHEYKKLAKENIELMLSTIVSTASPEWKLIFDWRGNEGKEKGGAPKTQEK
jgi:hypothetical protein